jgi:hypothetical protein
MKTLKRLICIAVLGLAVYSGYMYGMPYYRYYAFKSDAADIVRFRIRDPQEMKEKMLEKAKGYGVPVDAEDIQLWQTEDHGYRVKVSWFEDVNILDLYKKRLMFDFTVG